MAVTKGWRLRKVCTYNQTYQALKESLQLCRPAMAGPACSTKLCHSNSCISDVARQW